MKFFVKFVTDLFYSMLIVVCDGRPLLKVCRIYMFVMLV